MEDSTPAFGVDLSLETLQGVRMLQAILETGLHISVPEPVAGVLAYLQTFFGLRNFSVAPAPKRVEFDWEHSLPACRIGSVQRRLLFPTGCFTLLRSQWKSDRKTDLSFCGFVGPNRRTALKDMLSSLCVSERGDLDSHVQAVAAGRNVNFIAESAGDLIVRLHPSDKGRRWPVKAWDPAYFGLLLNSRYVVCPDGDFVWTYRFFEAAMCGAIPIIQNDCDLYHDFIRVKAGDALLTDDEMEHARTHNFAAAHRMLTVEPALMREELLRMIG